MRHFLIWINKMTFLVGFVAGVAVRDLQLAETIIETLIQRLI